MESFFLDNLFIGNTEAQATITELKRDIALNFDLLTVPEQNISLIANADSPSDATLLFLSFITQFYNQEERERLLPGIFPNVHISLISYNDTDDEDIELSKIDDDDLHTLEFAEVIIEQAGSNQVLPFLNRSSESAN